MTTGFGWSSSFPSAGLAFVLRSVSWNAFVLRSVFWSVFVFVSEAYSLNTYLFYCTKRSTWKAELTPIQINPDPDGVTKWQRKSRILTPIITGHFLLSLWDHNVQLSHRYHFHNPIQIVSSFRTETQRNPGSAKSWSSDEMAAKIKNPNSDHHGTFFVESLGP